MRTKKKGILEERFIVPPFSIFDSKQGYWKDRKKKWLQLGIQSEVGREGNLTYGNSAQGTFIYELRNKMREETGIDPSWKEIHEEAKTRGYSLLGGTSIFDPLICELAYTWFGKKGFKVLDPFCGGSVRGVVAASLGLNYTGIDLREEQIKANKEQVTLICPDSKTNYITGDSTELDKHVGQEKFDLIFSCPPYHDLEVYSKKENDLSNMNYESFLKAYRKIISESVKRLNENRFAVFVISDVRDKKGGYKMLSYETIRAFEKAGLRLWNEIICLNEHGSLPLRVTRPMNINRKTGRSHQKALVFYKGDPKKIREEFGDVQINDVFQNAA